MADNTFNFDLDAPAVPTLTLDPVEAPAAEEKQPEPAAAPEAEQVKLSPEEQAMVDAFAQKIDITNSQQVLQYGLPEEDRRLLRGGTFQSVHQRPRRSGRHDHRPYRGAEEL